MVLTNTSYVDAVAKARFNLATTNGQNDYTNYKKKMKEANCNEVLNETPQEIRDGIFDYLGDEYQKKTPAEKALVDGNVTLLNQALITGRDTFLQDYFLMYYDPVLKWQ